MQASQGSVRVWLQGRYSAGLAHDPGATLSAVSNLWMIERSNTEAQEISKKAAIYTTRFATWRNASAPSTPSQSLQRQNEGMGW